MWSSLCVAVLLLAQPDAMLADGFSQSVIESAREQLAPAIGMVRFTAENTDPGTGEITKRPSNALGLVVSANGLVMTHGHMMLENTEPSNIRFIIGEGADEQEYDAFLLKKPDDINICFLRLVSDTKLTLPAVQFTRDPELKVGEPVAMFGLLSQTLDYARGLNVHRVGAVLDKPRRTYCLDGVVRFGFVTGPVFNARGEAVGVMGFDMSMNEGGDLYVRSGHPLIYQAGLFQKYIDQPPGEKEIADKAEHAWLGVFTQPLNDDFAEYWGVEKEGGVIVSSVVPGSPADKAGLVPGDIIVDFNGTPIRPKQDRGIIQFTKLVRETGVGKTVPFTILRKGESVTLTVPLEARPIPSREAAEYKDEIFGMTVRELTTDVRIMLNLPDTVQGVIIRRIRSGGIAQAARMRPGIIIMSLAGIPVTNLEDFQETVAKVAGDKPNEVPVFCRAGTATGFFRLEPRWERAKTK